MALLHLTPVLFGRQSGPLMLQAFFLAPPADKRPPQYLGVFVGCRALTHFGSVSHSGWKRHSQHGQSKGSSGRLLASWPLDSGHSASSPVLTSGACRICVFSSIRLASFQRLRYHDLSISTFRILSPSVPCSLSPRSASLWLRPAFYALLCPVTCRPPTVSHIAAVSIFQPCLLTSSIITCYWLPSVLN